MFNRFKKINNKSEKLSVFDYFLLITITNIVLVSFAIYFYGDKFLFWQYPFSYAGGVMTFTKLPNSLSMYIYSLDMIISGMIILALSYEFYKKSKEHKSLFKTMLCFLAGGGFLIAGFSPDDTRHNFHVLGSALFVATLWILTTNYLFEIKEDLTKFRYYTFQLVLQIPIFAYAGLYFFNIDPASEILQKFALLGLGYTLLYSTNYITERK